MPPEPLGKGSTVLGLFPQGWKGSTQYVNTKIRMIQTAG